MARLKGAIELDGLSPPSAAEACGIPKSTFFDWMAARPDFADQLKASVAKLKQKLSRRVVDMGVTQWQADMTLMERLWPEEYGRRDRVRHEHAGQVGLIVVPQQMSESAILKAAELEEELSAGEFLELPAHEDNPQG